jgi:signal transduction histidine kinase
MKRYKMVWILGGVLILVGLIALALLSTGAAAVEKQAIGLFRGQQQLHAEQLAGRLDDRLDEVVRRLELPVSADSTVLAHADDPHEIEQALAQLSHRLDARRGITLFVHDHHGRILAVGPGVGHKHGAKFIAHEHLTSSLSDTHPVGTCEICLAKMGEVSVTHELSPSRFLAANVDASKLAGELFDHSLEGSNRYAELHGEGGRRIYTTGRTRPQEAAGWVGATAPVGATGWQVYVAAPEAVITPEIDQAVQNLMLLTGGILFGVIGGLIGLILWGRMRHREDKRRMQALAHQDKLATMGTLAASVAHEIRNSITVAQLNLQFAARQADGQLREDIGVATRSVEQLGDLAGDLASYAGKGRLKMQSLELDEVVDEAIRIVSPKLKSRVEVETDYEDSATVYGVSSALTQVVVNLLLNASDACDPNGGGHVTVRVVSRAGHVEVIVEDDGPGFADGVVEQVFEPFYSTKSLSDDDGSEGGTGIGLWLCAQILEQHGGHIRAENRREGGARLIVELPMAADS